MRPLIWCMPVKFTFDNAQVELDQFYFRYGGTISTSLERILRIAIDHLAGRHRFYCVELEPRKKAAVSHMLRLKGDDRVTSSKNKWKEGDRVTAHHDILQHILQPLVSVPQTR